MKESISYAFLLNIIFTFIFISFAVIMGIFSYYRAFRANTAILNSIEKYEGFNCLSQEEAGKSLTNLGYSTPFRANYKRDDRGVLETNDSSFDNLGYSVIYYDLGDRNYQYGVFTYMYMDLPVINQILKIPVFGKSNVMYEFRNLNGIIDSRIFITYPNDGSVPNIKGASTLVLENGTFIENVSTKMAIRKIYDIKSRFRYKLDYNSDGLVDTRDASIFKGIVDKTENTCGVFINYSVY